VNQEFTPTDIEGWKTPTAVRQTFSELGLNPDSTSWFDIQITAVDSVSEINIEFTGDRRCVLVLHENLEAAWLVGFVSRPIGTPSVRYHRFEPADLTDSNTKFRETLDRLNALDPESPESTADALSKSDLNDRFSNIVSILYREIASSVNEVYGFSDEHTKKFSSLILLTALRAKAMAEHPVQSNKSFQDIFLNQLINIFKEEGVENGPETLQPIYKDFISNSNHSLTTVPDTAAQNDFITSIISKINKYIGEFDWLLSDTTWSNVNQVTAHTIGIALERHLTENQDGGYHTPPELTSPVCDEAIANTIIDQINTSVDEAYTDISEILGRSLESITSKQSVDIDDEPLDQDIATELHTNILPELRIVDPAMGSGTFLLSALDTIVGIRKYVKLAHSESHSLEQYEFPDQLENQSSRGLSVWTSISQNLFGVDIDSEAVSLTRFRLELAYLCTLDCQDDFIPPRSGYNLKHGNSIIGKPFTSDPPYWSGQLPLTVFRDNGGLYTDYPHGIDSSDTLANEIGPILTRYRTRPSAERLAELNTIRERIAKKTTEINERLRFELYGEAAEGRESKAETKEVLTKRDAFHWPIEFPCVMDEGGFDVVLFHSPWSKTNIRDSLDKSTRDYLYSGSQYQLPPAKGWRRTSDTIDAFFLHRAHDIISKGGIIATLINESVLTAPASHHVRFRYLTTTNIDRIANFTNQNTFDQIDRRFKYAVFVSQARQQDGKINIGSGFVAPEDYTNTSQYYEIEGGFITRFSPKTLAFPHIEADSQLKALDKILDAPTLSENEKGDGWTVHPTGEFNQTTDSNYISETRFEDSNPIYRGSNIYQYLYRTAPEATVDKPDLWTIPRGAEQGISTKEYLQERKQTSDSETLAAQSSRIVYRRITNSANERSMIACLLPRNHFHINSLNSIDPHEGDQTNIERRLVLLGLLNSIPYDYLLRQKISNTIPRYMLFETRAPYITEDHHLFEPILMRVGRLNLIGSSFEAQRKALNIQSTTESEERRRKLRAEIDAAAFELYGFQDREVMEQILDDFGFVRNPRVMDSDYYDLVLDAFEEGEYRNVS